MTLGADALDAPGFDLLALFNGSEGLLGIVTEVSVKLLPKPTVARVLMASFDSVDKAGRAVADIIAAGIIPGGLEMMDKLAIQAAEDFIHAGYPIEAEAILLCELDGVEVDVAEDIERVRALLDQAGATSISLARDDAARRRDRAACRAGDERLHGRPLARPAAFGGACLLLHRRDGAAAG